MAFNTHLWSRKALILVCFLMLLFHIAINNYKLQENYKYLWLQHLIFLNNIQLFLSWNHQIISV